MVLGRNGLNGALGGLNKYYADITPYVADPSYYEKSFGPFLNWYRKPGDTTSIHGFHSTMTVTGPYVNKTLFEQVYGQDIWNDKQQAFNAITDAIVAYENGPEFALFNSKYDFYLKGLVKLSAQEKRGLELFEAEDKGNCAACHPSQMTEDGQPPLFTDYSYDNLGQPANQNLDFYQLPKVFNPQGKNYIDYGLAENPHINNGPHEKGKFKVSTLRNIAGTAPYLHNGVFSDLKEVVEFYNKRDVTDKWDAPEVSDNVNQDELGDLKLNDSEVSAIVAFLKTLTDGYELTPATLSAHTPK
mgnify:CR=1 FL=1